jgi:hypothetical protein
MTTAIQIHDSLPDDMKQLFMDLLGLVTDLDYKLIHQRLGGPGGAIATLLIGIEHDNAVRASCDLVRFRGLGRSPVHGVFPIRRAVVFVGNYKVPTRKEVLFHLRTPQQISHLPPIPT